MSPFPIDFRFRRKNKVWYVTIAWSDVPQAIEKLLILARFLKAKLIAGHRHDLQQLTTIIPKVFQCIQLWVLLGIPSEGGYIDHQEGFTVGKIPQREVIAG